VLAEIAAAVPAYAQVNEQTLAAGGMLRRFGPPTAPQVVRFSLDGAGQATNSEFPMMLLTERNRLSYNGVCLTREVKGLDQVKEENVLHVSPTDAARLDVVEGKLVKVASPYGSAYWTARLDSGMSEGTAFVSINPVVGSPVFPDLTADGKACAVRIEVSE